MLTLHNTLYCPGTPNTLVSLGKLDDASYEMRTANGVLSIKDRQGNLIGSIPKINGLYQIPSWEHAYVTTVDRLVSLYEAHCMSGHQNYAYVKHMFNNNQVCGIKLDPKRLEEPECQTCMLAKATRYPIATLCSTPMLRTSEIFSKWMCGDQLWLGQLIIVSIP